MPVNFGPLFKTAQVVTAVYRIASTTILMAYLIDSVRKRRRFIRSGSRRRALRHFEQPDDLD